MQPRPARRVAAARAAAFLLAAALALCLPLRCSAQSTEKERLLAFKGSFVNGADRLPSWDETINPCNGWAGVSCAVPGVVTSL